MIDANLQIEERWRRDEKGGSDQSEYGLNEVVQFPNTARSVRIGIDTALLYTLALFYKFWGVFLGLFKSTWEHDEHFLEILEIPS